MTQETKVELWMKGETAHLAVHSSESATFARVKYDLTTMRDRLTTEINNGPTLCPYSPLNEEIRRLEESIQAHKKRAGIETAKS